MASLTARDLMSAEIVSVPPETPAIAVARLLAERGISAVPVTDAAGNALGIITEADLIRRLAGEEDPKPSWFARMFGDPAAQAEQYARTHGRSARDVMSEQLVSVTPETPAAHVAHLMEERHIRRVLVLSDGKLAGIVSRADLLRALVAEAAPSAEGLSDDRIRRAVLAAIRKEPWADSFYTMVEVKDGVVTFHGFSRSAGVQRGLKVLAELVPGVKSVVDQTEPMPTYLYVAA